MHLPDESMGMSPILSRLTYQISGECWFDILGVAFLEKVISFILRPREDCLGKKVSLVFLLRWLSLLRKLR
jgi:hypothetical protein